MNKTTPWPEITLMNSPATELQRTGSVTLRNIQMEEYVAHGTIIMQSVPVGKSLVRSIQVQKMRGSDSDRQPRPYEIGKSESRCTQNNQSSNALKCGSWEHV
jgi:KaiC/GvpD/RAD55 family RecA-like ATPase